MGRFLFLWAVLLTGLGSVALVASWLAPNHYPPWTSFHGEALAFAALCCLAGARLLIPPYAQPSIWPSVIVGALLGLIGLQWLLGLIAYRGDALLSSLYVLGAGLAWWLGSNCSDQAEESLDWFAMLVVTAAGCSVLIAVLQWQRLESLLGIYGAERGPDMRVYANLAQPNHLATLCVMAVVLALWLHRRQRLLDWQFALLLGWLSLGLIMTESRSGLACALVTGVFLLLFSRRMAIDVRRPVIGWWILLVVGYLAWPVLNAALYLQGPRAIALTDDNQRLLMWKQCLAAIGQSPWTGYGWRQTMLAQKLGALAVPGHLATDYAHNFILDLLIWVGIPLGLLILLAAAWWLCRSLRRIANTTQLFLLAAAVPFLVHSLFEFPFAYFYFVAPAFWLLGCMAGTARPLRPSWRPGASPARSAMTLLLISYAVLCLALGNEYLSAEDDYRVMRFELRRVGRVPVGHQAPDLLLLDQLSELLRVGRLKPSPGMSKEEIQRLGIASARNGWATLDLSYAVALGLNGDSAGASRQLALLRAVYGDDSFAQALSFFRDLRAEYPQLSNVTVP